MGRRLVGGLLLAIPLLVLYLGLPLAGLGALRRFGLSTGYSVATLTAFGIGLTALAVARYVSRPTRLFGPASIGYGAALLAYLLWLSYSSTVSVHLGDGVISFEYGTVFRLAAVVPGLLLLGAVITTAGDALRPAARYPVDFPAT